MRSRSSGSSAEANQVSSARDSGIQEDETRHPASPSTTRRSGTNECTNNSTHRATHLIIKKFLCMFIQFMYPLKHISTGAVTVYCT